MSFCFISATDIHESWTCVKVKSCASKRDLLWKKTESVVSKNQNANTGKNFVHRRCDPTCITYIKNLHVFDVFWGTQLKSQFFFLTQTKRTDGMDSLYIIPQVIKYTHLSYFSIYDSIHLCVFVLCTTSSLNISYNFIFICELEILTTNYFIMT